MKQKKIYNIKKTRYVKYITWSFYIVYLIIMTNYTSIIFKRSTTSTKSTVLIVPIIPFLVIYFTPFTVILMTSIIIFFIIEPTHIIHRPFVITNKYYHIYLKNSYVFKIAASRIRSICYFKLSKLHILNLAIF